MKKMNKMYEAPKAEMIEMQMPVVLMQSGTNSDGGTWSGGGNMGGGDDDESGDN
jgi:hypothetical protein